MNKALKNSIRFVLFILAQGLIFGQFNFGFGIHPMIYPLFIILLPFEINLILLLFIAFLTGLGVDFFMNTFGLHASAAVLIAYLRPIVFRYFAPRDGYDPLKEPTANDLGYTWFLKVASILTVIHHLWFFALEYLKWSAWKDVLMNTILSTLVTLFIYVIIQVVFFKKSKTL